MRHFRCRALDTLTTSKGMALDHWYEDYGVEVPSFPCRVLLPARTLTISNTEWSIWSAQADVSTKADPAEARAWVLETDGDAERTGGPRTAAAHRAQAAHRRLSSGWSPSSRRDPAGISLEMNLSFTSYQ